eukprot:jgi/Mesvir1/3549/Mv12015-RA.1
MIAQLRMSIEFPQHRIRHFPAFSDKQVVFGGMRCGFPVRSSTTHDCGNFAANSFPGTSSFTSACSIDVARRPLPIKKGEGKMALTLPSKKEPMSIQKRILIESNISLASGAIAGSVANFIVFPIDCVKARVHAGLPLPKTIPELYRGFVPACLSSVLTNSIRMWSSQLTRQALLLLTPPPAGWLVNFISGSVGATGACSIVIPREVLKQRLQLGFYKNFGEAFQGVAAKEGLKGFYTGSSATLGREIPFFALNFMIFRAVKGMMTQITEGKVGRLGQWLSEHTTEQGRDLACGFVSGGTSAFLTNPLDVAKTLIMTNPSYAAMGTSATLHSMFLQGGIAAGFRGWQYRVSWLAPLHALFWCAYEFSFRNLSRAFLPPALPPAAPTPPVAPAAPARAPAAGKLSGSQQKGKKAAGKKR